MVAKPPGMSAVPGVRMSNCWGDAILVPADIGCQDGIIRHDIAQIGQNSLRHHREGIDCCIS